MEFARGSGDGSLWPDVTFHDRKVSHAKDSRPPAQLPSANLPRRAIIVNPELTSGTTAALRGKVPLVPGTARFVSTSMRLRFTVTIDRSSPLTTWPDKPFNKVVNCVSR
jgi:hypothetical protein